MPLDASTTDTYNPPASDTDPYSSISSSAVTPNATFLHHIDIAALPHGLPIFGPLTGYSPTNLARLIQARYAHTSQAIGRPLKEKEMTALAYHSAKAHAIASYGPTIGISLGLYRTYSTRAEYRWPFYGKLISEEGAEMGFWDGRTMRLPKGKEILANVSAQQKANLLHLVRGTAYVSLGLLVVPNIVNVYGTTVSAVGELRDERLRDVMRELRNVANKEMRERQERMKERVGVGETTGQGRKSRRDVWRERREKMEGKAGKGDDVGDDNDDDDVMSPTGGAMMDYGRLDEEQGRLSGMDDMGGVLSDGQVKTQEVKAQPETGNSPTENRASTFQMEKVSRQPKSFGDDYDDASPTGGRGIMDDDDAGGGGGGGSVWERIRQQQASGSSPAPTQSRGRRSGIRLEQQKGSTAGDSFSFSSSEEERNYAKDEAQKEFDERVERERRGGDFSGESGRRW